MEVLAAVASVAFIAGLLIGVGITADGETLRAYMDRER